MPADTVVYLCAHSVTPAMRFAAQRSVLVLGTKRSIQYGEGRRESSPFVLRTGM